MGILFFSIGLIQCAFIWLLGRVATKLRNGAEKQLEQVEYPGQAWPSCSLIIPVAGSHPAMEAALRTLCEQDYPAYSLYLTSSEDEMAALPLIEKLINDYPGIHHVKAPLSAGCAQKNANLLAALEQGAANAEIFAFCDSTHLARPDFLRCLVFPLAQREAAFSTGYHQVIPKDFRPASLGYAITATFMRLMQGLAAFTQPWGGAMAMTREAFSRYEIGRLWAVSVVDDCSLAALLQKEGVHAKLCPGALLFTWAKNHSFAIWQAWLERQILFLKFCMRGQWLALGCLSLFMLLPCIWALWSILGGLFNYGNPSQSFLALLWFLGLSWGLAGWRPALPDNIPFWRWIPAFFLAVAMFARTYARTLRKQTINWHNIEYLVAPGGHVEGVRRMDGQNH